MVVDLLIVVVAVVVDVTGTEVGVADCVALSVVVLNLGEVLFVREAAEEVEFVAAVVVVVVDDDFADAAGVVAVAGVVVVDVVDDGFSDVFALVVVGEGFADVILRVVVDEVCVVVVDRKELVGDAECELNLELVDVDVGVDLA